MRVVSPLLKRVVYPSLAKAGIFRRAAGHGVAVLTYHGLLPQGYKSIDPALDGNLIDAETFRRQLRLLKSKYNVIAPEDMLAWCDEKRAFPPHAVLLTCDDGLLNLKTEMLPVLLEEKLQCLFFVTGMSAEEQRHALWYEDLFRVFLDAPAGKFDISSDGIVLHADLSTQPARRTCWWNSAIELSRLHADTRANCVRAVREYFGPGNAGRDRLEQDPAWQARFHLLTRNELHELDAAGMTIGAHTMSHPMLSQLAPALASQEIAESRATLELALGKKIWALAYPFGTEQSVNEGVLASAERAGFAAAFMNYGGGLGADLPHFALPRIHVTAGMGLGELEAHIAGFYLSMQKWAGRGGLRVA